jgi:hypothetical protein
MSYRRYKDASIEHLPYRVPLIDKLDCLHVANDIVILTNTLDTMDGVIERIQYVCLGCGTAMTMDVDNG